MTNYEYHIDRVFYALSDSTRRAVLAKLSDAPTSVSQLAEPFEMALPSFLQHLKVLEECGLATSQKTGRTRTYQLAPEPLMAAENWLMDKRRIWEARLNQLDNYLLSLKGNDHA